MVPDTGGNSNVNPWADLCVPGNNRMAGNLAVFANLHIMADHGDAVYVGVILDDRSRRNGYAVLYDHPPAKYCTGTQGAGRMNDGRQLIACAGHPLIDGLPGRWFPNRNGNLNPFCRV